ncbi:MAG: hypothetical protein AAGC64_00970 [Bacteroidota bacterium]
MKKILFLTSLTISLAVLTLSCSSDDDASSNCDSCTVEGVKIEFCDNGNGTYIVKAQGTQEDFTDENLEDLGFESFDDYREFVCSLESLTDE